MQGEMSAGGMEAVICTVDVVLLCVRDERLQVLLMRREHAPYAGSLALPGGFIHTSDADAKAAAMRVLQAKTGQITPYLEQLATFSGPQRDPRGWSLSVVYYALLEAGKLSADASLFEVDALPELAFDHLHIIHHARARLRSKSMYSSLPCYLLGETFTLPQLQKMYEIVGEIALNKADFRRKMKELDVLEEVTGQQLKGGAYRPAQLYRLKPEGRDQLEFRARGF